MNKPILSICIPTYSRAHYLKRALESIKIQLEADPVLHDTVEVVISDNCSTDNTTEVAEGYRKYFEHFTYVRNEKNVGFDLNVFNVVKNASGKYCWYLGDDDVIINGAIEFVYGHLKDGKHDIVTIEAEHLPNVGDYKQKVSFGNESFVQIDDCNEFYFNGYCQGAVSVLIFNRDLWLEVADIDDILDYWLYFETVLRVLGKTKKPMLYIKQPGVLTGQDCRWAENGAELITFVNSNVLMEKMMNFGFDRDRLAEEVSRNSRLIVLMLLRAKGHGLKSDFKNLKFIFSNLHTFTLFQKILVIAIYFIPNKIIALIRDLKKKIK